MPGQPLTITTAERRRRLGVRHLLLPSVRTNDVVRIAYGLVALHGSDPATVYLSAGARMQEPSLAAVAAALYEDRSLIRHHAMRRTVWIMPADTARAAHASSGRKVAATERRALLKRLAVSQRPINRTRPTDPRHCSQRREARDNPDRAPHRTCARPLHR